MKPNFKEMTKQDLRAYVLAHRDDQEAFYAYVDILSTEENRVKFPPLKSINDMENYPDLLDRFSRDRKQNH
jgi:hypothetical protein